MSGYRFLTGRQRQIRYHGSFEFEYKVVLDLTQTGAHQVVKKLFHPTTFAFMGWVVAYEFQHRPTLQVGLDADYIQGITSTPTSYRKTIGAFVTASGSSTACVLEVRDGNNDVLDSIDCGWDGTSTDTTSGYVDNGNGFYTLLDVLTVTDTLEDTVSGDWEFIADVEEIEWRRYTSGVENNEIEPLGAVGFPVNRVEFAEVLRPGGSFGWNVGAWTDVVTISARTGADGDFYWPWCSLAVQASPGETTDASLSAIWDGGGYTQTPTAMSVTDTNGSASESAVSVSGVGAAGESRRSVSRSFFPVHWKYLGVANAVAFGSSIPDTSEVEWFEQFNLFGILYSDTGTFPISRGSAGEFGFAHRAGGVSAGVGTSTFGGTSDSHYSGDPTISPPLHFGCRFSDASYATVRPQLQSFCLRGPGWDQFGLYQEQYKYYAKDPWHAFMSLPVTTKGWYPGATVAITSISEVSDKLRIVTSATGGTDAQRAAVLKLLTDRVEMRHVGIRIRSIGADNLPFTLRLGAENYTSTTVADGTWVERMFDRYDQHYPSLDFTAIQLTDTLTEVAVEGLSVSSTYEVEWIRGERMDHSKLYVGADIEFITDTMLSRIETLKGVPAELFNLIPPVPVDTGDNPSSWVLTDLAPAPLDQPADIYDPFTPGTTDYLTQAYHQNSTAGFYPYLDGLGFQGDVLDIDVAGSGNEATLRAYPLAVSFDGYPGAGDILGGGSYAEDTPCNFDMVVRAQAFGPILGSGAGTQEVVLVELDATGADVMERGRGSADGDGYYVTGSPYARSIAIIFVNQLRAWLDDQQPTALTATLGDGGRWWILWRATDEAGDILTVDTSPTGRTSYSGVQGGVIMVHHAINWTTNAWMHINTGIVGEVSCLVYEWGGHRIWLSYLDGSDVKRVYSDDGGSSFSVAVTIASSASQQAMAVFPTGWLMHVWRDGSAIKARGFDAFGTALWAAVTAVGSGVEDAGIGVTWDESAQRWYILYRNTSGNVLTVVSADGGQTWS